MSVLENLLLGFQVAVTPSNLLFAFIGTIFGMAVGVLPGLGPSAAVALLIPVTASLDPTGSIIMLIAIFYGSQFGGTITSVLLNVPGEVGTAVTCFDGYPMAQKGRGGAAMTVASVGSAFGGILASMGIVLAAPALTAIALKFGPPEQFALFVFALCLLLGLAGTSLVKALIMGILGLLLGTIGLEQTQGFARFTFGLPELFEGVSFIPVVMGLFGLSEMLLVAEEKLSRVVIQHKMNQLLPTREEVRASIGPTLRGSVLGFFLGLVPGMGTSVSSFLSYSAEQAISRKPETFGKGNIAGVAGPETANNAHATSSLIPLLTLGIPTSPTIAIILGAFLVNGLVPGPLLFRDSPEIVWGVIASFFIGNLLLLVWSIPCLPIWVSILRVPQSILISIVACFMVVGAYAENSSVFGIAVLICAGMAGYIFQKLKMPVAPFLLAFVIGPRMEEMLVRSLEMFGGHIWPIFQRPIAVGFLLAALIATIAFSVSRASLIRVNRQEE